MTLDDLDNLLEVILFDNTYWVRMTLQELENDGVILPEERISLVQSLVE